LDASTPKASDDVGADDIIGRIAMGPTVTGGTFEGKDSSTASSTSADRTIDALDAIC
jgi:hypothetical protein